MVTDLSADRSVAERDSIVGLVPNLAARIQQAAEPGMVVISDVTRQLVDADFYLHSLGERRLKGISRPVEVFAVERPRYAAARFEAERYRKAGLVGRDDAAGPAAGGVADVRAGRRAATGAAFLVVGEAGIGKSRLVAEVLDRVEASGGRVLGVGCLPYYANVSLWPMARLLERVLGVTGDERATGWPRWSPTSPRSGWTRRRSVPFLGPLARDARRPPSTRRRSSTRAPSSTRPSTGSWSGCPRSRGAAPHLLVVEDLHWADPSTLGLLGRLVDRRPAGPAHGGHHPGRLRRPLAGRGRRRCALGRLDGAAAARLIDNLVGRAGPDGDRRAAVIAQAEGIPLFIEELTRSYLDDTRTDSIPLRMQELFTSRLKAPGIDLRVVQVAATVGPTFDAGHRSPR